MKLFTFSGIANSFTETNDGRTMIQFGLDVAAALSPNDPPAYTGTQDIDHFRSYINFSRLCGEFEDADVAPEAWMRTTEGEGVGERGLARVLEASGPVPWQAKAPLLRELMRDERWHAAIFHSIQWSAFDVFGSVDVAEATAMLRDLRLSGEAAAAAPGVRAELESRSEKRADAQRRKLRRRGRRQRH